MNHYKFIFSLVLALIAGLISLLTGRNRRQLQKIPKGMVILCQPPGKRYLLYAMGVLVFALVAFVSVLYILDGAPENARSMWGLCVGLAVFLLFVTILSGNMMAKDCVYFDREKLQIEKPFRKPRIVLWQEVRKIGGNFEREVRLYLADGTKALAADSGMVNYELFCGVLKENCPAAFDYYQPLTYDEPEKYAMGYVLVAIGILILLVYLAMQTVYSKA